MPSNLVYHFQGCRAAVRFICIRAKPEFHPQLFWSAQKRGETAAGAAGSAADGSLTRCANRSSALSCVHYRVPQPFWPAYVTEERLKRAPKLALSLTAGIGSDHVDLIAASKVSDPLTCAVLLLVSLAF